MLLCEMKNAKMKNIYNIDVKCLLDTIKKLLET